MTINFNVITFVRIDIFLSIVKQNARLALIVRGFGLTKDNLVVYLSAGGLFLMVGFVSLFRIRNTMKKRSDQTDKLETLIVKVCTKNLRS